MPNKKTRNDIGGHLTSDELASAVFYHPNDPKEGTNYEDIFTHLGGCSFCKRSMDEEREANPLYEGYLEAVEKGKVKEYWEKAHQHMQKISGK